MQTCSMTQLSLPHGVKAKFRSLKKKTKIDFNMRSHAKDKSNASGPKPSEKNMTYLSVTGLMEH